MLPNIFKTDNLIFILLQVTGSMAGVVKSMESAMKSMNLEKVGGIVIHNSCQL